MMPAYATIQFIQDFESQRRRALWSRLWRWLTRRPRELLPFEPVKARLSNRNRFESSARVVPTARIVGSVNRAKEFDRQFRPLKDASRERWVTMRRLLETIGWEPIVVDKVGDLYFVEDGHHRVSVARALGLSTIEAVVFEYPVALEASPDESVETVLKKLERLSSRKQRRQTCCAVPC